jgi:putative oxidoreductase
MKSLINLFQLNFIPSSTDCALLALRLWLGISMVLIHGLSKMSGIAAKAEKFPDPFGIGPKASLGLAIFAEVVCSGLLIIGLFTRFAALNLMITMGVAFLIVHKMLLKLGPGSGELAFIYLGGFLVIFMAGPGAFSLDAMFGGKKSSSK